MHDHAAEQGAAHARETEDGSEQALVAAALAWRDDVADDGLDQHDQASRPEPLHGAKGDQLGHRLRLPAKRRSDQEQDDRTLQDALATVEVAELAIQRRNGGLREQESARHPRQAAESAEVTDDRGQGCRDDRLVERREQHHQHQPPEDHAEAGANGRGWGCCYGDGHQLGV